MSGVLHASLADGRWQTMSLIEQMGNIGSEVGRAARWQGRDAEKFQGAADRALELFRLTLADPRWRGRRRELARARELLCGAILDGEAYGTTLADLERYFTPFAMAAQLARREKM